MGVWGRQGERCTAKGKGQRAQGTTLLANAMPTNQKYENHIVGTRKRCLGIRDKQPWSQSREALGANEKLELDGMTMSPHFSCLQVCEDTIPQTPNVKALQ